MKIFILGSGNIAFHLSKAFIKNNIPISGIYARNKSEGKKIAKLAKADYYNDIKDIPENADLYLICVADDAIKTVAQQIPKKIQKSKIVAHTSGSKAMNESLPSCKNKGVFYPLQTFSKGKRLSYKKIPFCINGSNESTIQSLSQLAQKISISVQTISDAQRRQIHLSAVIINNFVNHMIFAAENLLDKEKIDTKILQPLLEETIRKQKSMGAFNAQTGPARRADLKTIEAHLQMLRENKQFANVYKGISKSIEKTYKKK